MSDIVRYFQMLSECNQILLKGQSEKELAQGICDAIVQIGEFDSAFMGLLKNGTLDLSVTSGVLKPYADKIAIRTDDERFSSGASGRALKDGQTHIYNDVTYEKDYDAYKEIINETGLKANLAVPLKINSQIIGTLGVYSKTAGIFGKDEKRLFEELAGDLAYGIASLHTRKREALLFDMLKRVRTANQRIAREEDLESLIDGFCKDVFSAEFYHMVTVVENGKIHCTGECCERFRDNFKLGLLDKNCDEQIKYIDYRCKIHPEAKILCIGVKGSEGKYAVLFVCVAPEIAENSEELALLKELAGDLGVGIDRIKHHAQAMRLLKIVDNIAEEVYTYDFHTFRIDFSSKGMREKLGYTLDEMKRLTVLDISPMYDNKRVSKLLEPLLDGRTDKIKFEAIRKTKDGTLYPVDVSLSYYTEKDRSWITAIAMDITEMKTQEAQIESLVKSLVKSVSDIAEMKDPYTAGHQRRVSMLAVRIAQIMSLDEQFVEMVRIAGLLHDIGKVRVPSDILTKPTKLRKTEFDLIKEHSKDGYEILNQIPSFDGIAIMVLEHHERMDGSGYPSGLLGDEITIGGRILAVADVIEAMASHRPYRPAFGIEIALDEIKKNAGRLYDRDVVKACITAFDEGFKFELK